MRAALQFEFLKLRKSIGFLATSAGLVVLIPLLGAGFHWVATNGGTGALAGKAKAFTIGEGLVGLVGSVSQIAAAACFIGVGVGVVWIFGNEHVNGTFSILFAQTVRLRTIATAKSIIALAWIFLITVGTGLATWLLAELLDVGNGTPGLWMRLLGVVGLAGLLGLTVAGVASATRSYLPAIVGIIVLVASAQFLVLFGVGEWFPYAVPGLLAVSGSEGAPDVSPLHAVLAVVISLIAVLMTIRWWDRAEVR